MRHRRPSCSVRRLRNKQRGELFGARQAGGAYDFSSARTLAIFCNGPWCGQTPNYIRTLLALGFPAEKLKWYRGGMQEWCALGLTVV